MTTSAQNYARLSNDPADTEEAVVNRFFGIFFGIFQLTNVSGNLISSLILGDIGGEGVNFGYRFNMSKERISDTCGPYDNNSGYLAEESRDSASKNLAYVLMAVYTAVGVLSVLFLLFFLEPLEMTESKGIKESNNQYGKQEYFSLVKSTVKHIATNRRQQLIAFITIYSGFNACFFKFYQKFNFCSIFFIKVRHTIIDNGRIYS